MLFRVASIFSTVFLAQVALAALTPDQVVENIKTVTTVSANINVAIGALTPKSSGSTVISISKTTVIGFNTIITDIGADVTAMQSTPPFNDVDAQLVVNVLVDFVKVHQLLLATVIGKHGILAQFGVTAPVAAVLRTLEAGIDSFALGLIALIPTKQGDVTNGQNALDESVGTTIDTYDQICIPSPLYPSVMPICASV